MLKARRRGEGIGIISASPCMARFGLYAYIYVETPRRKGKNESCGGMVNREYAADALMARHRAAEISAASEVLEIGQ